MAESHGKLDAAATLSATACPAPAPPTAAPAASSPVVPAAAPVTAKPMLSPAELEKHMEGVGYNKVTTPASSSFVLAMLAGMFIALGASFMLVVRSDAALSFTPSLLLGGLSFCLGLFLVLVAGAELFTGNVLMVAGCLAGRYGISHLLGRWLLVYAGNLVGSLLIVLFISLSGMLGLNDGAVGELAVSIAAGKAGLSWSAAFVRGILCNILVCLAVWAGNAGSTVCDKLAASILPVVAFLTMGFEHSVANMYFLPLGLVAQAMGYAGATLAVGSAAFNLLWVTAGNIVGGTFIGVAYWYVYTRPKK